jgi:hypothetical protein
MKSDDRYVAVSYVRGSSSASERATHTTSQEHECLPEEVSKTIEDAMIVVKSLEIRYLWVYRYCIWQMDEENKHIRVCNMDNIYERAFATIVAVSGSDA